MVQFSRLGYIITDMKFLLLTLSLVGCVLAEAPYPEPRKPQGALLLLPPEDRQDSYVQASEAEDLSKVSDKVMERLRQETGSNSGSYHVYLADGRLQKVQYTTAPVQAGQQNSKQNYEAQAYSSSQQNYQQQQYAASESQKDDRGLHPVIAQFGRLQQDLMQQQIQQLQQKQQQLEQQQQELRQQQEQLKSANYVASLQFSNVDPITSPIYSYKPSPVTRILRYAPKYI